MTNTFVEAVDLLHATPFPERYRLFRELQPRPPPGKGFRQCTAAEAALLAVMAQNWRRFGVKRMTNILGWTSIHIYHLLAYGVRRGYFHRHSKTMYSIADYQAIRTALGDELEEDES